MFKKQSFLLQIMYEPSSLFGVANKDVLKRFKTEFQRLPQSAQSRVAVVLRDYSEEIYQMPHSEREELAHRVAGLLESERGRKSDYHNIGTKLEVEVLGVNRPEVSFATSGVDIVTLASKGRSGVRRITHVGSTREVDPDLEHEKNYEGNPEAREY